MPIGDDGAMDGPSTDVRNVPPWLAGLIAIAGYPLGVGVLTFVPQRLGAPTWVVVVFGVAGAALGYLTSRAILRWLYTPR